MTRIEINPQHIGFPMPVALLGSRYQGRANFMTVAWLTRVNFKPPQIGVAVGRSHATAAAIADNGCFSLSIPAREQVVETDYVGLVSAARQDKSAVFEVFTGELEAAPMAAECPVTMECRLVESLELPTNTFYVGEIIRAYGRETMLDNGKVDLARSNPLLLSMPDNRYWSLGEPVAAAWSAGKAYRQQEE